MLCPLVKWGDFEGVVIVLPFSGDDKGVVLFRFLVEDADVASVSNTAPDEKSRVGVVYQMKK